MDPMGYDNDGFEIITYNLYIDVIQYATNLKVNHDEDILYQGIKMFHS